MENKKEKTAPDVSVGANTEQPIFKNTTSSISENNLENPQFDENKLVFTCFKIKNASPNK